MGKLSYPGERRLLAAEQNERGRERIAKSWAAAQARADRAFRDLPLEPEDAANGSGDGGEEKRSGKQLVVHDADKVDPEPVDWIWPGRFAIGKTTLKIIPLVIGLRRRRQFCWFQLGAEVMLPFDLSLRLYW